MSRLTGKTRQKERHVRLRMRLYAGSDITLTDKEKIPMDMDRRQFFRVSAAGLVGSSLAALGFSPTAAMAETRGFKLRSEAHV